MVVEFVRYYITKLQITVIVWSRDNHQHSITYWNVLNILFASLNLLFTFLHLLGEAQEAFFKLCINGSLSFCFWLSSSNGGTTGDSGWDVYSPSDLPARWWAAHRFVPLWEAQLLLGSHLLYSSVFCNYSHPLPFRPRYGNLPHA